VYDGYSYSQSMNGTKISFEAFLKNPSKWTVWTAGGLQRTAHWVSQLGHVWHGGVRSEASHWFPAAELTRVRGSNNQVMLSLSGLRNDNNNVYIINVIARRKSTGESAPLHMLTLQMRTPVYDSPAIVPRDAGVIIGARPPPPPVFARTHAPCHVTRTAFRNIRRPRRLHNSFPRRRHRHTRQTQNESVGSRSKTPPVEVTPRSYFKTHFSLFWQPSVIFLVSKMQLVGPSVIFTV
jgi:hypothetical protein